MFSGTFRSAESMNSSTTQVLSSISNQVQKLEGVEEHGVCRVEDEDRINAQGPLQHAFHFWFGCSFSAVNMVVGMLAVTTFSLRPQEAALLCILATTAGCVPVGLVSCLGPVSGLRTMVMGRFATGWNLAKAVSSLNAIMLLGYSIIDVIMAGNISTALANEQDRWSSPTIILAVVGAVAVAFIGISAMHVLERVAWVPQLVAVAVLIGGMLPQLHGSRISFPPKSTIDNVSDRLGIFMLTLSSVVTWSTMAADYFVNLPKSTPRWRLVIGTATGLWVSSVIMLVVGIALGVGAVTIHEWNQAYTISPGALVVKAYEPLGVVGTICSVILSLGNLAPAAAGIYSQALAVQAMSRRLEKVRRPIWTLMSGVIVLVCALAGKDALGVVLQNFLAIVGYWVVVWLSLFAMEYCIRRGRFDWRSASVKSAMPHGYASAAAFCVGFTVSMLSMAQIWATGPIAKAVRPEGADVRISQDLLL